MIVVIRGHIRKSFLTEDLYNLIKEIYKIDPTIKIFIHTWNCFANGISWRESPSNFNLVNEDIIFNYFKDLKTNIKHITIEDDKNITLIGNVNGTINGGSMPIIGWKNYWYGKFNIISDIYNSDIDENETIINLRFDLLSCSSNTYFSMVLEFIKNNINLHYTKNRFLFDYENLGLDNIYIGNKNTMYKLAHHFFYNLDTILERYKDTIHQELYVFRENHKLFE